VRRESSEVMGVSPVWVRDFHLEWGIGLSLGEPTGYAISPARDFRPRLAHAILPVAGKGASDWGHAWIPVAGPLIGGSLVALLYAALGKPAPGLNPQRGKAQVGKRFRAVFFNKHLSDAVGLGFAMGDGLRCGLYRLECRSNGPRSPPSSF